MNKTFEDLGIVLKNTSGQEKTTCPKCSEYRKKQWEPCLSVNIDDGVWNCHNCGWKGSLRRTFEKIKTDLPETVTKWFRELGIEIDTLTSNYIGYKDRWIQFPFYKNGQIVNIKSRTADKKFKQERNAEKCFYRFDYMKDAETIIITEGEIDALSLVECGIEHVVSCPDGAPAPDSNPTDRKFSYLLSAEEALLGAKTIILATDDDPAGHKLRDELSRRIGREKCFRVVYPNGCKDINEVLVNHGEDAVLKCISEALPYPIDGVVMVEDVMEDAIDLLQKPDQLGLSTGWECLDHRYRISPSEVTVVTGVPNMGKSEWMDALMINMVQLYSWKFGIFSAENFPVKHHLLKLTGKFTGQPFWGSDRMKEDTARNAMTLLNDHIKFIGTQETNVTVESILEQAKILNYRYGLHGIIIDPWNTVEHKFRQGESETNYVSRNLAFIITFAKINELHIWIVSHQKKMEYDGNRRVLVPTAYDISGSANWFNKCDNVVTVHRHKSEDEDYVGIHIHKIRFQYKNGKPGLAKLQYNVKNGRYFEYTTEKKSLF